MKMMNWNPLALIVFLSTVCWTNAELRQHLRHLSAQVAVVEETKQSIVDDAEWFHLNPRNGRWSEGDGANGRPSWTKLRYDFTDTACRLDAPNTKPTSDMSVIDFKVSKEPVVLNLKVLGFVTEQHRTRRHFDKVDVLNVFVDGNWLFQATASVSNDDSKKCHMMEHIVTRNLHHDDGWEDDVLILQPGSHSISVEVRTTDTVYHAGGFYEIDFAMKPVGKASVA